MTSLRSAQASAFFLFACSLLLCRPYPASAGYLDINNQAVALLEKGDFSGGIALLKDSLQQMPDNETVRKNLHNAYQAAGHALMRQQRYPELVALMDEAHEFAAEHSAFLAMRGYGLFRLKRFDEAEDDLLAVRYSDAADASVLFLLGRIFYQTDRMYEARDVLEDAFLLSPENTAVTELLEKVKRESAVEQEMDKEYGGHFIIIFDGEENAGLGREVLSVLEDAYLWAGLRLGHYPEQRVPVILYSQEQFRDLTSSPHWAGGLYDGKIRLPVGGVAEVGPAVSGLLYHEYMHVVLRDLAGEHLPYWLNEGLAEIAEREHYDAPLKVLPRAALNATLFNLEALEGPFSRYQGERVTLAYEQSYLFVRFLLDEYGWFVIREILEQLADAAGPQNAVDRVFAVYGLNYRTLQERWRVMLPD